MEDIRGSLTSLTRGRNGTNETDLYANSRGLGGANPARDVLFAHITFISVIGVAFVLFCGRIAQLGHAYLRRISSLAAGGRRQAFWSMEDSLLWAIFKKHVLYAPLGRKRYHREIQLPFAISVGILPSRLQAIMIVLYTASQIAYCTILSYNGNARKELVAELRGRSGTLAVINMVLLVILAGRNNPLIPLLRVSFDSYNLLHRWLGFIVVIESSVHSIAWGVNAVDEGGIPDMLGRLRNTPFFAWGLVGTISMAFLLLHSLAPVRHAFYETFLHLHQLAAFLALLEVYTHLDLDNLPQRPWVIAVGVLWILDRVARLLRVVYLNFSLRHGSTSIVVEALPGAACKVTFHLPKPVHMPPGSHIYAYIPSVSCWMSHPFSVAWVEPGSSFAIPSYTHEDRPLAEHNIGPSRFPNQHSGLPTNSNVRLTTVSLIVVARNGMTRKLYNKALATNKSTLHLTGFIEGPYSSCTLNPTTYGTAILFSAGAGITHHLLTVRDLLIRISLGQVPTQKVYLIWSVRSAEHLSWVSPWMESILCLPGRRNFLTILLFVSQPESGRMIRSPNATVQMFPRRCIPGVILDDVIPIRVGATLISVCAPGAFADEVRDAARSRIGRGAVIDFVEEAFTW